MKEEIDENKEKEVIQKAYKYNGLLGIWIIAVFISFFTTSCKNNNRLISSLGIWFTYPDLCYRSSCSES